MGPYERHWEEWLEEAMAGIVSNALPAPCAVNCAPTWRRSPSGSVRRVSQRRRPDRRPSSGWETPMPSDVIGRRVWRAAAQCPGGGAALAAVLHIASWKWGPFFQPSWLLVGLAALASRPLRAWGHDAGVVLAGVARGTSRV